MIALDLNLELSKTNVFYGESIPFVVTLTNVGRDTATVRDLGFHNAAVTLVAVGGDGKTVRGNAQSVSAQRAEPAPHNRSPEMETLAPGESVSLSEDALRWLGDLVPDTYNFTAYYSHSPMVKATSKTVSVTVKSAAPTALYSGGDGARLAYTPRQLPWLNRATPTSQDVWLLSLDALGPLSASSHSPLTKYEGGGRVFVSSAQLDPAPSTYVLWKAKTGALR